MSSTRLQDQKYSNARSPTVKLHIPVSVGSSNAIAAREGYTMPPGTAVGALDRPYSWF